MRTSRIVALVAGSMAVLLMLVSRQSLWVDEAISVAIARMPWQEMWTYIFAREGAMGFFYGLLHLWGRLGDSDLWFRSLPLIFGVGAIPLTYLVGRRLVGARAAALSSALLASHSLFVAEVTEIRSYSLAVFLAVGSTLCFLRAIEANSRMMWTAYAVLGALAVYAHLFNGFILIAHILSLMLPSSRRPVNWSALSASLGAIALLIAPLCLYVVSHGGSQISWIPRPDIPRLAYTIAILSGGLEAGLSQTGLYVVLGAGLVTLYVIAIIVAVARVRGAQPKCELPNRWNLHFLLLTGLLPLIGASAFSFFVQPVLHARYLVVLVPALVLLVAKGIDELSGKSRIAVLVLAICLSTIPGGGCYGGCEKENWKDAISYLASSAHSADGLLIYEPFTGIAYDHYARLQSSMPRLIFPEGDDPLTRTVIARPNPSSVLESVLEATSNYERIWLILSHANTRESYGRDLFMGLVKLRGTPATKVFTGIRILTFD